MNELRNYTRYEYKRITMTTDIESLWKDSMASFGWEVVIWDGLSHSSSIGT